MTGASLETSQIHIAVDIHEADWIRLPSTVLFPSSATCLYLFLLAFSIDFSKIRNGPYPMVYDGFGDVVDDRSGLAVGVVDEDGEDIIAVVRAANV
ncbi:MAG: hypothetical protein JXM79_07300 [Sedimentisphaerales bacterium]|nr:hypothetical protein [Sedimentisphaerales bacterium]